MLRQIRLHFKEHTARFQVHPEVLYQDQTIQMPDVVTIGWFIRITHILKHRQLLVQYTPEPALKKYL